MEEKLNKENKPRLGYDWNLLGYAQVAERYLKQGEKGIPFAKKSLELILKDVKISDPWIVSTVTDPRVVLRTIESQLETYNQFKKNQTAGDLMEYYNDDIIKYLDENSPNFQEESRDFVEEKYSDIIKKIGKAEYIIEGKKKYNIGSDEDIKNAKEIIDKYGKFITTINMLESQRMSKFQARVEEEMTKDTLKELYKKD